MPLYAYKTSNRSTQSCRTRAFRLGTLFILFLTQRTTASTILRQGHADIGIAYDQKLNQWDLHVHDETQDIEYSPPSIVWLSIGPASRTVVPTGFEWHFLGAAGLSTWILPQVQTPDLLFLGIGTEEIEEGVFTENRIRLTLQQASGPGIVSVFDLDAFGNPSMLLTTEDGVSKADSIQLTAGGHRHLNWAFSAPGDYTLTFQADGSALEHGATLSELAEYHFQVDSVPEPSASALTTMLFLGWLARRRDVGRPRSTHEKEVQP